MPRGQYDRTKTKEQRQAEKLAAANKSAGKTGRGMKMKTATKAKAPAKVSTKGAGRGRRAAKAVETAPETSVGSMSELVNLGQLRAIVAQKEPNQELLGKFDREIGHILDERMKQRTPELLVQESDFAASEPQAPVEAVAPRPTPLPFNPPTIG